MGKITKNSEQNNYRISALLIPELFRCDFCYNLDGHSLPVEVDGVRQGRVGFSFAGVHRRNSGLLEELEPLPDAHHDDRRALCPTKAQHRLAKSLWDQ